MFKPVYAISAKSNTEVDILIYGAIGESFWEEGNSGKKFVTEFAALEQKYDKINVRINSPGGSVWDGLPMFNAIKASKKDTHTYIDGIAYSMGAMVALAGKTVHAAKGSLFLLHNVSGFAMGNAQDMRDMADEMDIYDDVLSQLIADKTGKTVDEVKAEWMNHEDHLMSATSAFESKLVDVIENYDASNVDDVKDMSKEDLMEFYNPKSQKVTPDNISVIANKVKKFLKNQKKQDKSMGLFGSDFPKLNAVKDKKAGEISAEDISAINAELKEKGCDNIVIISNAHLTEANNNADAVTNGLTAINTALGLTGDAAHKTIANAIAGLTAAHKTAADEAKKYGKQPGALATQVTQTTAEEKDKPLAEGGEQLEAPTANKFETSYDRELAAKKLKNKDNPFN